METTLNFKYCFHQGRKEFGSRMKALSTLRSFINQSSVLAICSLIGLSPAIYPEITLAAFTKTQEVNQPLVFEIKNLSKQTTPDIQKTEITIKALTIEELQNNDPLATKLKSYLKAHGSPLNEFAGEIIVQEDWQKALAISWVESNFGKYCFDDNCSGIGVKPGHPLWRKYPNKLAWFKDLSQLLQKPLYKERYSTCRKMKGVYVQPGTENWVRGCEKKYAELMALTAEAENERIALTERQMQKEVLHTFPELALLTQ